MIERWSSGSLLVIVALSLVLPVCRAPAFAQAPSKVHKIGILTPGGCPSDAEPQWLPGFLGALKGRGYVPGHSIVVECRFSGTLDAAHFQRLASELVRLNVDVILASSSTATQAVRPATSTIPVVALDLETDPVASGLAASLARPGGNVTGIFLDAHELNAKWLELLRGVLPRLKRGAVLWEATTDPAPLRAIEAVARSLGIKVHVLRIRSPGEFDAAFRDAKRARAEALLVMQSPMTDVHRARIAALALEHCLPSIAMFPTFPAERGLMSYGPAVEPLIADAAAFVDRILKGAKPGDVPIERPTRFYLVANRTTAKTLGLTLPPVLLSRADQVIE